MMQTSGLTDGFVRTGIIALTYGQVSVNATRCKKPSLRLSEGNLCTILQAKFEEHSFPEAR